MSALTVAVRWQAGSLNFGHSANFRFGRLLDELTILAPSPNNEFGIIPAYNPDQFRSFADPNGPLNWTLQRIYLKKKKTEILFTFMETISVNDPVPF